MRIRQIALVARDLEPAAKDVCEALGIEVGYRDPGVAHFGLHNVVCPVGDTFLEIVSPTKDGTTAGRLLEKRRGDGGYMVILQTDDLPRDKARLERMGVRTVWDTELEDIAAVHLHPKDVGAAIVSFDQPKPPESWRWAGPEWTDHVRTNRSLAIVAAEIQAADPAAMAERWGTVLDETVRDGGSGSYWIDLEGSWLTFVPARDGRGDGLRGFTVRVTPDTQAAELDLCGVRVQLVR